MPRSFDLPDSECLKAGFVALSNPTHIMPLVTHFIQMDNHLRNRAALAAEKVNFLLNAKGCQHGAKPAPLSQEGVR
jgi:hypothetical protein